MKKSANLENIVPLLLKDHEAMRELMEKIQSPRSTNQKIISNYKALKRLVSSHMKAEEAALVNALKNHPKFEDEATESYEEHRVHEHILKGISDLRDKDRAIAQMKIFCEILEHHLGEEEEDLFPQYKKYFALSTRKLAGRKFVKKRELTRLGSRRMGALAEARA